MIIVLVILSTVTINGCSGQAEGCGGLLKANNGTLQLEPSHRPCLWVITLKNKTGVRLELSPSMVTPILVIPQQNVSDENLTSVWINGSKEVFYTYAGKNLAIVSPYRTETWNLSWTGLAADNSGVSLSAKFENGSNGTFEWKHDHDGRNQIFWALHYRTGGEISWDLDTLLPACYPVNPCESLYFTVLEIMGNGTISKIEKTCEGSSNLSINIETGSQVLVLLDINAPVQATTRFQVTWKPHHQSATTTTRASPPIVIEEIEKIEEPTQPAKRPQPTKPTPTPFQQCALPYRPYEESTEPVSIEDGVSFGNFEQTSRMEFTVSDDDKTPSAYSIEFKTSLPDGLIFIRSEFDKADYVALFMKKGYLIFAFVSGSGAPFLNSTKALNDSQWHTAVVTWNQNQSELSVDGVAMATGKSPGSTTDINAGNIAYVGGFPPIALGEHKNSTGRKLLNVDSAFRGCLRNFLIRDRSPGVPTQVHSVEPCRDDVEPGYFFYPNSGFMMLGNKFQVGINIKISLSIKPRHPSGLIMAVHGNKDYIILQMLNGTVKFTVNNGHGPFSSSFTPSGPFNLCDGKWHTIMATKMKNVATLAIDGQDGNVGMGSLKSQATDTQHPLYLGGQPKPNAPGVETNDQFVGCIKDLVIHGRKPFKFSYESIEGRVAVQSCPVE